VSFDNQSKRNEVQVKEKYQCTDKKYLGKNNGSRKKKNEIQTKNSAKSIGGKEEPLM
jgi:hypothetical protein